MEVTFSNVLDWILYLLLIFIRVLSTFALSPIFGRGMPAIAKIILSLCISYIVLIVIPPSQPVAYDHFIEFAMDLIKEGILGLIFSYVILMFTYAVHTAGQIIDLQLGFSFAQVYNPVTGAQNALTGTFLNILLILLFFVTDSHLLLFRILYDTFTVVPPGQVVFNTDIVKLMVTGFLMAFTIGVKIAMPVLVVSLITEVLLGVVMRAVPNVNFFVIGFPVKIFIGFFIMIAAIPVMARMSDTIFENMFMLIQKLFEEMGRVNG